MYLSNVKQKAAQPLRPSEEDGLKLQMQIDAATQEERRHRITLLHYWGNKVEQVS